MSVAEGQTAASVPTIEFAVLGAAAARHAATPRIVFTLGVTDSEALEVYTIALQSRIVIDPTRRTYDEETRSQLVELFGPPERWRETTEGSISFAEADVLAPSFSGAATFELPVPVTYDLEVAGAKYADALPDGHVPLTFTFTGTVFYRGDGGRLQLVKVPWTCSARFRLPVSVWREAIEVHYGASRWIRLHPDTLARLQRRKAERGLPSFEATLAELLDEAAP